jgi:ABC-2 type transport system permease protein
MRALKTIYVIWLREWKRFMREKARIIGMLAQPLLYLLVMGKGLSAAMGLKGAPPGVDYLQFMYPGILGMSVLFTSIFSALSIIWDREFGFLKEVLVAPVPRWAVAVGKSLGGATVAMVQTMILLGLAPFVGVDLSVAMVVQMLLLMFLISFGITSFGLAIAARMESMQGFQMIMNFLIMPLYFLSGAMFPLNTAPDWMQVLGTVNPLTYAVDGIRNIMFDGTVLKQVFVQHALWLDVGLMAAVALVLTLLSSWQFSRSE